ncbi:2-oxoglutarate dehydrogenase E1 component [Candidatus Palauibacter sp.]|uniref:2-oxoglutarate dehydrogenase E1 component n=1 Tax=Candidatus Palauibacter sp. TaxID=3101350 RepID=UPI003AF25763
MNNNDGDGGAGDSGWVADGYNAGYAEGLYERSLRDRGLIPPPLAGWGPAAAPALEVPPKILPPPAPPPTPAVAEVVATEDLRLAAIAGALVEAYRAYGHLGATIDPLGSTPPRHPLLEPEYHGIRREELARVPASAVWLKHLGDNAAEVLDRLEEIYCGPIGYELDQMENPTQRDWLVDYIESHRHRLLMSRARARGCLEWLTRVQGLERFLHRTYLGKKRFSVEGLDMIVPMLRGIVGSAGRRGARQVFVGMAHRGRLNVLAHVMGLSYESIVAEFEEQAARGIMTALPEHGSGDVKYHVGGRSQVAEDEVSLDVRLAPNPSHLEHVNPVVLGMARAARFTGESCDASAILPILIHGDASFAGQGVVAETLNLCRLSAYETGGTIHIITNNQLGFTTLPGDSRSTRYASDLSLGFRLPVVHVNADDPEACMAAVRLAVDYRFEFGEDLVIDLVGYRRYGHNEGDEPSYTQPMMYERVAAHPRVREQFARVVVGRGLLTQAESDAMVKQVDAELEEARGAIAAHKEADPGTGAPLDRRLLTDPAEEARSTGIAEPRLRELNDAIHRWPADFTPFHKLRRQLERRRAALDEAIDWGHAEALALAGLLTEGVPVRLTGEDTERGTFSHRHLVLHDAEDGRRHTPIAHIEAGQAPLKIANSPLSEIATLGFEYGFSTIAADALVLWEAQFGDFANVGQAIIDQFVVSGRSKWGLESRLVLLLPHGYEGQGPEHSSARFERFLQLAAEGNIRVVNCTTPAQYFHALRWQALRATRRPLIVMTPKSLLRHPRARSSLADLTSDMFRAVLGDQGVTVEPHRVDRVLICSGKVYFDLLAETPAERDIPILRVEQPYPFPAQELEAALAPYPDTAEICWVQEEPENMGAWTFMRPYLRQLIGREPVYIGRPERASPAEGYFGKHARRQQRLLRAALRLS